MTIQRSTWLPFTALVTTAAFHAPYATAAETPPRDMQVLQEIIVTATKRTERLQDVPIAVSAITGEDIQARGFTNYADYLNSIPGVYFQDAGPGHGQIRIRGISAAEGGVPSTTATYFGETVTSVLTNFGGKPNLRLVDIDRVEVLRGPQGTLFGASALAGVVRIIPNAPDLQEFEANVGVRGFTTAHSGRRELSHRRGRQHPADQRQAGAARRRLSGRHRRLHRQHVRRPGRDRLERGPGRARWHAGQCRRSPAFKQPRHQFRGHVGRTRHTDLAGDRSAALRLAACDAGRHDQQRIVHDAGSRRLRPEPRHGSRTRKAATASAWTSTRWSSTTTGTLSR